MRSHSSSMALARLNISHSCAVSFGYISANSFATASRFASKAALVRFPARGLFCFSILSSRSHKRDKDKDADKNLEKARYRLRAEGRGCAEQDDNAEQRPWEVQLSCRLQQRERRIGQE